VPPQLHPITNAASQGRSFMPLSDAIKTLIRNAWDDALIKIENAIDIRGKPIPL